jgi:hypothetical protein
MREDVGGHFTASFAAEICIQLDRARSSRHVSVPCFSYPEMKAPGCLAMSAVLPLRSDIEGMIGTEGREPSGC